MNLKIKDYMLAPHHLVAAEVCPAARVYALAEKPKPHPAMWWGIGMHLFLQYAATRGKFAALAYMRKKFPQHIKACSAIDVDQLPKGIVEAHVILDTDQRVAMEVDAHGDGSAEDHVYARADVWCPDRAVPRVVDYKTGERAYDPLTSMQMLTLGSMLWAATNRPPRVEISIINVHSSGKLVPTDRALEARRAGAHLDRLRHVHLEVLETRAEMQEEGVDPSFNPGPHCDRCHVREGCDERWPP